MADFEDDTRAVSWNSLAFVEDLKKTEREEIKPIAIPTKRVAVDEDELDMMRFMGSSIPRYFMPDAPTGRTCNFCRKEGHEVRNCPAKVGFLFDAFDV